MMTQIVIRINTKLRYQYPTNKLRVLSTWGLGSGLVSQVRCLGDALAVVVVKKLFLRCRPLQICLRGLGDACMSCDVCGAGSRVAFD